MANSETPKRPRGRPRSAKPDTPAGTVQSLDRALNVLTGLARFGRTTLTDIALQTGVPTATTYRILTTLQKHGFAEFDDSTQEWMVGIEAFRTGNAFLSRTDLLEAGRPYMRALMKETGETANMAIADGGEVVFVGQTETQQPIRAFFKPGTRTPMHASGIGKALLAAMDDARIKRQLRTTGLERFTKNTCATPDDLFADLERIRTSGWSYDKEERYDGMSCVGAAIYDASGEPVAGISVSGPSARLNDRAAADFGPLVRKAAHGISQAMGWKDNTAV